MPKIRYRDWLKSQPQELPDGFVKVSVILTAKEAEVVKSRAALTPDGTYSAGIRDCLGLRPTPHGFITAVEKMINLEEK